MVDNYSAYLIGANPPDSTAAVFPQGSRWLVITNAADLYPLGRMLSSRCCCHFQQDTTDSIGSPENPTIISTAQGALYVTQ